MTSKDRTCFWLSIASVLSLSYSRHHTVAYQRPLHNAVISSAICAILLVSTRNVVLSSLFATRRAQSKDTVEYALLVREDEAVDEIVHRKYDPLEKPPSVQNGRIRITLFVVAVLCLSLRLETYRRISIASECTIPSVEVWLPLLLALYDSLRFQKPQTVEESETVDATIYESMANSFRRRWLCSRARYVLPVTFLCLGCHFLLKPWRGLNSTTICPIVSGEQKSVPLAQYAGLLLDCILAIIAWEHLPRQDGGGLSAKRTVDLWSYVLATTALIWVLIATGVYYFAHHYRYYLVLWDVPMLSMLASITIQAMLFSITCITTLHCVLVFGVMEMSLTLTSAVILGASLPFLWAARNPFPAFSKLLPTIAMSCLFAGWWCFQKTRQFMNDDTNGPSRPRLVFILGLMAVCPVWFKSTVMHFHPIDLLIYEASLQHDAYLNTTASGGSLADAVLHYQERYHRNPPPGFDIWYEFAVQKGCLIIDEYDQIYEDLLPFYSLEPADIRRLTWEIASNQWNEAAGVTIRNGTARVQDNVVPTHRWMIEGVQVFIDGFARFLPDMDLVFNINDEPRVAVPYKELQEIRQIGMERSKRGTHSFSANRAAGWLPESTDFQEHNFRGMSFKPNFRDWGSVGCPPASLSRRDYALVGATSTLCTECAAPHSLGQFVSNWTLAADMCHQPDMAHLHGFYMSPAAFKPAYALKPVFSQSKPHGFNDILYPSAWNYLDKVKYAPSEGHGEPGNEDYKPPYPDPPFQQKNATLFWRGATSEGVSTGGGQWRGMTRQRLVHLVNNVTSHPHDEVMVLLPHSKRKGKWQYTRIPGNEVRNLGINTDVRIVDFIARCGDSDGQDDCGNQHTEFSPGPGTDFQAHWTYKYLFDLDGAGFSGRFLPFLQSRSLPFKSALFREWYDSRLTAWRHFVPQDLRLHGVWSTLVYFAGVDGTLPDGTELKLQGHAKEAEKIAEQGREWANTVLRKEDMEVYFFRLLLEWGRMTDDNRDNLGFTLET